MISIKARGAVDRPETLPEMNSLGFLIVPAADNRPSSRKRRLLRSASPHSGDCLNAAGFPAAPGFPTTSKSADLQQRSEFDMLTLQIDVEMTRRKRFFFVFDEHESLLWSGQRMGDALDWLTDQGHLTVFCTTADTEYVLTFRPKEA